MFCVCLFVCLFCFALYLLHGIDPRSFGSQGIKGTVESTLGKDFSVPLMHRDPSGLASMICFPPQKNTPYNSSVKETGSPLQLCMRSLRVRFFEGHEKTQFSAIKKYFFFLQSTCLLGVPDPALLALTPTLQKPIFGFLQCYCKT